MAQAVSRQPLTAEAQVRALVSPRGICDGQNDTATGLSQSSSVFFLPVSFHQDPILIYDLGMKNGHIDAAVQRQLNPST
jgi:hypothetical protein